MFTKTILILPYCAVVMLCVRIYRYIDRPVQHALSVPQVEDALPPENYPAQHWLDNRGSNSNNAAYSQMAPSSSPLLRAAATTFEYNPPAHAAAAGVSPTAAVSPGGPAAAESLPETGTPRHADYLAAWRAMSWPPLVRPVDPEFPSEDQPQQPRRRYQGHGGSDNGAENSGGGSAGRRRVQARSASRDGRPQSSTDARRAGGGLGGGGGGADGGGTGGWNAEGDDGVDEFPFSSVRRAPSPGHGNGGHGGSGGRNNSMPSDVPGGHWHDTHRAHAEALLGGNPANLPGWRGRGLPSGEHQQRHEAAVDGHPRVVGGSGGNNGSLRRETVAVQPHRGRRSLSDFLREIEEMVRAQREVRTMRTIALRAEAAVALLFVPLFSILSRTRRENTAEFVVSALDASAKTYVSSL